MTFDKAFEVVAAHEGGAEVSNDGDDRGGRTQWGVSERSNPQAWADGQVTKEEAQEIFVNKYVVGPGFHTIPPSHKHTQLQLIDFGFLSGPAQATMKLQETLNQQGAKLKVDGDFGPKTLSTMLGTDDRSLNNLLMAARIKLVGRVVKRNPGDVKWLSGWLERCLSFLK